MVDEVRDLSIQHIPNVPIYDKKGAMTKSWLAFFRALFARVGGTSGDIIYNPVEFIESEMFTNNDVSGQQLQDVLDALAAFTFAQDPGQFTEDQIDDAMKSIIGIDWTQQINDTVEEAIDGIFVAPDNTQLMHDTLKGYVQSVEEGHAIYVDNTDPQNPIVNLDANLDDLNDVLIPGSPSAPSEGDVLTYEAPFWTNKPAQNVSGSKTFMKRFDFGDGSPIPLFVVGAVWVFNVEVRVTDAFNGVGVEIEVGDAGVTDRLLTVDQSILAELGTYENDLGYKYGTSTQLNAYFTQGTAPSSGTGYIIVTYQD